MRANRTSRAAHEIRHHENGYWWGVGGDEFAFERTSEAYFPTERSCQQAIDEDIATNS